MEDWLEELSRFSLDVLRAAFKKSMTEFVTAPPTLPQLVQLCIKESGVPNVQQVIRLMVNRDFSHPLVKMVYDKIGSWTLSNGKEEEIQRKAKEYYTESLSQFHVEPEREWLKLADYNAKPKELPPPDKIPSAEERRGFKERMAEYQKMADEAKEKLKDNRQKEFDYSKLKPGAREFDELLFSEYKAYLVGIPENMVLTLSVQDAYARMRFLAERDQAEYLKKAGYVPPNQRPHDESPKGSDRNGRPTKVYKTWMND
ncbi:MAG: hypothetical protein KGI25_04470 [Thaumarchaeota archaeon]|nr:hypothetical protein [Nitrososphaerota archaeon]